MTGTLTSAGSEGSVCILRRASLLPSCHVERSETSLTILRSLRTETVSDCLTRKSGLRSAQDDNKVEWPPHLRGRHALRRRDLLLQQRANAMLGEIDLRHAHAQLAREFLRRPLLKDIAIED